MQCLFHRFVPKKDVPLELKDFRPISLLGFYYKIIAKILARRLALVIDKIISRNQTVFISGRQILDSSLIANEIVNQAKKSKTQLMLFNWEFLFSVMEQMGFAVSWRKWIKGCLSSASVSVLIN